MNLYFNGCSHTYGDDLLDPATQAWPAIIAQELGCTFLNDSCSGGTNDRIMYRTIKNINQFDKFYIAWTYISRFTRYRADNNHEVNFNSRLKHNMYGNTKEFELYGLLHYKNWYNELYAFKLWLQNVILLQNLFKAKNKPYVMINTDNNMIPQWTDDWPKFNNSVQSLLCFNSMNDEQLFAEHQEIQQLVNQIDFLHYIGWNNWWLTQLAENYIVSSTGHLLADGHLATAHYILEKDNLIRNRN